MLAYTEMINDDQQMQKQKNMMMFDRLDAFSSFNGEKIN